MAQAVEGSHVAQAQGEENIGQQSLEGGVQGNMSHSKEQGAQDKGGAFTKTLLQKVRHPGSKENLFPNRTQ